MRNEALRAGALLTVCLIALAHAAPATTYSRDQLIEDVRELVRVIEQTHPDPFVRCGGRIAYYRVFQEVIASIPEAGATLDEFVHIVRPLIGVVGDGHTGICYDYPVNVSRPGGVPLSLGVIEESLYVSGVRHGDDPDLIGARLLSVEGVPLAELCLRQRRVMGAENRYHVLRLLAGKWLYYKPFLRDILPEWEDERSLRVALELPTGEIREVEYASPTYMTRMEEPSSCVDPPQTGASGFVWTFWDADRTTAYLRVDHMSYYREAYEIWRAAGSRDVSDEELAAIPSATESFRELVIEMRAAGTETLIVDLRQNEGGHSLMADILLNFLYPREVFLAAQTHHVAAGGGTIRRYSEQYFAGLPNESIEDFAGAGAVPLAVGEYDFSAEFTDPAKRACLLGQEGTPAFLSDWYRLAPTFYAEYLSEEYAGYYTPENVLVVTTATTYSSGFTLAEYLYLAGATLVGTPSGQSANCYGEIIWWKLSNTGLAGGVSGTQYIIFPEDAELGQVLPVHYPLTYEKLASYGFDPNASLRYALEIAGTAR